MRSKNIVKRAFSGRIWSVPLIAAFLCTSALAEGATLTVGTCPGGGFSTIQSAINAASSGDTVDVCPGAYPEQVSINKSLTLEGIRVGGQDAAVVEPPAGGLLANATDPMTGTSEAAQVLVTQGSSKHRTSVTLQNLIIDGANNGVVACTPAVVGILYQDAGGTVLHVATRNQTLTATLSGCDSGTGIRVESSPAVQGTTSVTVRSSTIHDYQKNGITALGDGSSVSLVSNSIRGQGPTTGGPENGIQVSFGAVGQIENNDIIDNVFIGNNAFAASGVLVFASSKVRVTGNTIGNNQFGIAAESTTGEMADNTTIKNNVIFGSVDIDGIDLCSNNNVVSKNRIANSGQSGVDLDSGCGTTGNNNTVTQNGINEACAGILEESGTSGNTIVSNKFFNVINTILSADACPAQAVSGTVESQSPVGRRAPAPSN
jgi:hypothetical protein